MNQSASLLLLFPATLLLAGCAAVDSYVKVPSGAYNTHEVFVKDSLTGASTSGNASSASATPPTVLVATPTNNVSAAINYAQRLNWVMPLVEIDASRFIYHGGKNDGDRNGKDKTPIYLAYDISRLENGWFEVEFPTDTEKSKARNDLVRRILYRSNANFDTYASRARTYDRSDALLGDTLSMISTATISGVALVAPPVAAGFAGAHVLASGINSNVQKDFLNGGTIDSILAAMNANRQAFQVTMTNKLFASSDIKNGDKTTGPSSYDSYPILDVLDDVRQLNQLSSIYGATAAINDTAAQQVQNALTLTNQIKKDQTSKTDQEIANGLKVSSVAVPAPTGNASSTSH